MIRWIVSAIMMLAGVLAGFFAERQALNYEFIQMILAIILITLIVFVIAFWPSIKAMFHQKDKK